MMLRLPFVYSVVGIAKGMRKVDEHIFGAWTAVEIREASGDDVPVAMRWTVANRPGWSAARWDGSDIWTACLGTADGAQEIMPAADLVNLVEAERKRTRNGFPHGPAHLIGRLIGGNGPEISWYTMQNPLMDGVSELAPDSMREVLWTDRRVIEDRLRRNLSDLLLIDGQVWKRGGEPFYTLNGGGNSPDVWIGIGVDPLETRHAYHGTARFRADRLADVMDAADQAAAGRQVLVPHTIEVVIPEAVTFDDEAAEILRAAADCVDLAFDGLRNRGRMALKAWQGLRDAVEEGDPERAACALSALSEEYLPPHRAGALARRAIDRWDLRPMLASSPEP